MLDAKRNVPDITGDTIGEREVGALVALNETLRDDYIADCQKGVDRWNRALAEVGASLRLPHLGFNRAVGNFKTRRITPDGDLIDDTEWRTRLPSWLPTDEDRAYVESLMIPVTERGKMASWIAPPATGIHNKPVDFEYVRFT